RCKAREHRQVRKVARAMRARCDLQPGFGSLGARKAALEERRDHGGIDVFVHGYPDSPYPADSRQALMRLESRNRLWLTAFTLLESASAVSERLRPPRNRSAKTLFSRAG